MPGPIGQRDEGSEAVEVPGGGRKVGWLNRVAAEEVQAVEPLGQAQEIAVVPEVAFAAPALEIVGEGRAGNRGEGNPAASDGERALRVAGMEREGARCGGHGISDELAGQAHSRRAAIHVGARVIEHRKRPLVQELDADLLENGKGPVLDEGDLIPGYGLKGRKGVDRRIPGRLMTSAPRAALTAPS